MKKYYDAISFYQLDYKSIDRKDGIDQSHKKIYDEIVGYPAKD